MEDFFIHFGYPVIILVLMASGFGIPVPEDIPLLVTGYLCSHNPSHLWVMTPLVFFIILGSDCFVYAMGRRYGHHVPKLPILRRFLTEQTLTRAERLFHAHGGKTLFVARFLPGLRTPMFFTAGVFKLPFWKFLLFDGSAALISVPTLVLLGFFFANKLEWIKQMAGSAQWAVAGAVVLLVAGYGGWKFLRRRRLASAR